MSDVRLDQVQQWYSNKEGDEILTVIDTNLLNNLKSYKHSSIPLTFLKKVDDQVQPGGEQGLFYMLEGQNVLCTRNNSLGIRAQK